MLMHKLFDPSHTLLLTLSQTYFPQLSDRLDILLLVRHFSSRMDLFFLLFKYVLSHYHTTCNHTLPFGPFGNNFVSDVHSAPPLKIIAAKKRPGKISKRA